MGMAASQARLLTITARMHDVEYQAQAIQSAKLQLATQQNAAYNEYLDALDSTTLTVSVMNASGATERIPATFNNLFSSSKVSPNGSFDYALQNNRGQLIVEKAVYDAYQKYQDTDAFTFAIHMISGDSAVNVYGQDLVEFAKNLQTNENMTYAEQLEKGNVPDSLIGLRKSLEEFCGGEGSDIYNPTEETRNDSEKMQQYRDTLNTYRKALYKKFSEEICTTTNIGESGSNKTLMPENRFDYDKFNYYMNVFNQIKSCGGCVPITEYNGKFGDAASNGEWLQGMIQSGNLTISMVKEGADGELEWTGTSPGSDSYLSYTTTSEIDSRALKKAEAKYEKELKEIDQQDKQHDLTLSKLETERTALKTEYDQVKKIVQDNIERTFGIFS